MSQDNAASPQGNGATDNQVDNPAPHLTSEELEEFITAVRDADIEKLRQLLLSQGFNAKPSVSFDNQSELAPLLTPEEADFLIAARHGDLKKLRQLLGQGVNVNCQNDLYWNALHFACEEGHIQIIGFLVQEAKVPIDEIDESGRTALHIASFNGHYSIVRSLLYYGANPNALTDGGCTPIYLAAQENHPTTIRMLLDHGADPNMASYDGYTPLDVAKDQGHQNVVLMLGGSGEPEKVPDWEIAEGDYLCLTPAQHKFLCSAASGDLDTLLKLLNNPNISSLVDIRNRCGYTALHLASQEGQENIVKELIARGATLDVLNKAKETPLEIACFGGHYGVAKMLLTHGAKTNIGAYLELHQAVIDGHVHIVRLLLEHGADIEAVDVEGYTPMQNALYFGLERVVEVLKEFEEKKKDQEERMDTQEPQASPQETEITKLRKELEALKVENWKLRNNKRSVAEQHGFELVDHP